jgi:hypothetical protein
MEVVTMKRFIDLRGQHTGYRFAWWDTVSDEFDEFCGNEAWDTWEEFSDDVSTEHMDCLLERYKAITPAWAFEPDPDDDSEEDGAEERRC